MSLASRIRRRVVVACCALSVAFFLVVSTGVLSRPNARAVDDIASVAAALAAAVVCGVRAMMAGGRWRLSWLLLAGALGASGAGEATWAYYELVAQQETPFPSWADLGYLSFPVLALAGMLARPSAMYPSAGRLRVILDGVMVTASLFVISWSTSLGSAVQGGADGWAAFTVGLAYPVGDLVLVTTAVQVARRTRVDAGTSLLIAGLACMAVSDSAFSYLSALGVYGTGSMFDVGWFAAYLAIGSAALWPVPDESKGAEMRAPSTLSITAPYVLVVLAGLVDFVISRHQGDVVARPVEALAILALLGRQFLTAQDNRRLAASVLAQQSELRYRAFHDSLTGLANRSLFYDRLSHAVELHARDMRSVSVLLIDLDDFKVVNDTWGHDAGDELLVGVARRLDAVLRAGDTLARLGGDEFAALLEDDGDAAAVADRFQDALAVPIPVLDRYVSARASIGAATLGPSDGQSDTTQLMKRADLAMYSVKQAGKGASVLYSSTLETGSSKDPPENLTRI